VGRRLKFSKARPTTAMFRSHRPVSTGARPHSQKKARSLGLTSEPRGPWSVSYKSRPRAACPAGPGAGRWVDWERALASAGALSSRRACGAQPPGPGWLLEDESVAAGRHAVRGRILGAGARDDCVVGSSSCSRSPRQPRYRRGRRICTTCARRFASNARRLRDRAAACGQQGERRVPTTLGHYQATTQRARSTTVGWKPELCRSCGGCPRQDSNLRPAA
jgi:hypothetical protein